MYDSLKLLAKLVGKCFTKKLSPRLDNKSHIFLLQTAVRMTRMRTAFSVMTAKHAYRYLSCVMEITIVEVGKMRVQNVPMVSQYW